MEILSTRKRIAGTLPYYEYRLFVPFDQLSVERQGLIHYWTDFGRVGGPFARLSEVIAPIAYLRMEPGLTKFDIGREIAGVAKRVEATIIAALYPEMTAEAVPPLFLADQELDDALIFTRVDDLIGRYEWLARVTGDFKAGDLGLDVPANWSRT